MKGEGVESRRVSWKGETTERLGEGNWRDCSTEVSYSPLLPYQSQHQRLTRLEGENEGRRGAAGAERKRDLRQGRERDSTAGTTLKYVLTVLCNDGFERYGRSQRADKKLKAPPSRRRSPPPVSSGFQQIVHGQRIYSAHQNTRVPPKYNERPLVRRGERKVPAKLAPAVLRNGEKARYKLH